MDAVVCSSRLYFFQAEDGIRDYKVTGVQTCALPIYLAPDLWQGVHAAVHRFVQRCHRSEEHTSELQSPCNLVCRLLLEKNTVSLWCRLPNAMQVPASGNDRGPLLPIGNAAGGRFFFNDTATTEIYPLSLHDALPICCRSAVCAMRRPRRSKPGVRSRKSE